jgi:hypothetical protein
MVLPISNPSPVVRSSPPAEPSAVSSGAMGPSRELTAQPGMPRRAAHSQSARGFDELGVGRVGLSKLSATSSSARFAGDVENLLPPANVLGRSDRFDASPNRLLAQDIERNIAPAKTPLERISDALDALEFHAPAGEARTAQMAMQVEYIPPAAKLLEAREKAFGPGGYSLDQNRSIAFGEAALPALYDGVRQFFSSMSRSPLRNAVATLVGPRFAGTDASGQRLNAGELNNNYDPSLAGGVAGAATAYAVDTALLSAMDRRARLANFPEFKPVDLKVLVPDPAPVQLRMVNGRKEFWRPLQDESGASQAAAPGEQGMPSMAALKDKAETRRKLLTDLQDILESKQWGLLAQPMLAGGANVLRRAKLSKEALLRPLPVLGHSMWASGMGGAAAKLSLGLAKSVAWADVDNLVGGKQRVNLFATQVADPNVRPAGLADYRGLPGHAWQVAKETASLATHFAAGPWRSSGSRIPSREAVQARIGDLARTVVSNVFASVFSTATGPLVAQILRNGASAPLPGESPQSSAYLLQQAAQSATNDFVWQASREALRGSAYNLGASLDRWRDDKQARSLRAAHAAQNELPGLATRLLQRAAGALPAGDAPRIQAALAEVRSIGLDQNIRVDVLQRALAVLKDQPALASADPQGHASLVERAQTVIHSMVQREESKRWRDPLGTQAQADRSR